MTGCDLNLGAPLAGVDAQPAPPIAPEVTDCIDRDGDGYGTGCGGPADCDDFDPLVHPGAPERCDYVDNDCDGDLDEGLNLGATCTLNLPACSVEGLIGCEAGGRPRCIPLNPLVETCNGVDDDCDGVTDEGDLGADQDCELAWPGVCKRGRLACNGGEFTCENRITPGTQPETCNGLDDDCDGYVDNQTFAAGTPMTRSCYGGPAGTGGVGACAEGTDLCTGGLWTGCTGQVLPHLEICDLIDNNCDGLVDNAIGSSCTCSPAAVRSCYAGPAGTAGAGPCIAGSQICGDGTTGPEGQWGACAGAVLPQLELCNELDDDCDGDVDEQAAGVGSPCASASPGEQLGICRREGELECNAGVLSCAFEGPAVVPETETCNGLDDDCDGRTDEGPDGTRTGTACSAGVGACARTGAWACADTENSEVACNATAGPAGVETCNGVDDDCDGTLDEGLDLGAACQAGTGACVRTGVKICGAGGAVACSATAGGPTDEICDSLDNDCDGQIDESLGLGNVCDGNEGFGMSSGCGLGVIECAPGGATRCSTALGGSAYPIGSSACTANGCPGWRECSEANVWSCNTASGGSLNPEGVTVGQACTCVGCCPVLGTWECGWSGFRCSTSPAGGSEYTGGCE